MIISQPGPSFLLDWQAAELAALEHMRTLGFIDAQKTPSGADGGIDVASSTAVAQVKFYANPVGRPDIQRLRGAAHEYRIAIFYSTGGYTREAVDYAEQANVALFTMDPYGRASTASNFATVLSADELVHERREHFEAMSAARYGYAADALERDLELYARFARKYPMFPEEAALYGHVSAGFEQQVHEFRKAAETGQFETADKVFEAAQKRISFLMWLTSVELRAEYDSLEDAIGEGWMTDTTPGSEHLLHRACSGAFALNELYAETFGGWSTLLPDGVALEDLRDERLDRNAGLLMQASADPSILSQELIEQLKSSVRACVGRAHDLATSAVAHIFDKLMQYDLPHPRGLVSQSIKMDALVERIYRQLDAETASPAEK